MEGKMVQLALTVSLALFALAVALAAFARPVADSVIALLGRGSAGLALAALVMFVVLKVAERRRAS